MASKSKSYIIAANEDVSAAGLAENEVLKVIGGAEISGSESVMQGEEISSQYTVSKNEDFGIATASLIKKEADQLGEKNGIGYVEDEKVFATYILDQDGNPFSNDNGDLVEGDSEAAEEIEYAQSLSELDDISDDEAAALAAFAADYELEGFDEMDFDEEGSAFALSGSETQDIVDAFASAAVTKGSVYAY